MIDPIVNKNKGIKKNFSSKFEKTEDQPTKKPMGQISSDLRRSNVSDLVTSLEQDGCMERSLLEREAKSKKEFMSVKIDMKKW